MAKCESQYMGDDVSCSYLFRSRLGTSEHDLRNLRGHTVLLRVSYTTAVVVYCTRSVKAAF